MIGEYLNQTVVWGRVTGQDPYGQPIQTQEPILVRWEDKRRLVRDAQGQEVISEARVYCRAGVQPGDTLTYRGREWPVIAVSIIPSLDDINPFVEVAL